MPIDNYVSNENPDARPVPQIRDIFAETVRALAAKYGPPEIVSEKESYRILSEVNEEMKQFRRDLKKRFHESYQIAKTIVIMMENLIN